VQECFVNIEKHAQAKEASVLVRSKEDKFLLICISDNGMGFSPPDRDGSLSLLAQGHFGLWGMYERAASLSGTLIVDSSEGEGATITLQIPLISLGGGGGKKTIFILMTHNALIGGHSMAHNGTDA
jgi:signal transduction histidine kinase